MNTLNELFTYIESLNKSNKELTQEDICRIGVYHKELPLKEKSWSKLASFIEYPGTADSLRGFVNRYHKMHKVVTNIELEKSDNKEFEEEYKENVKIRDVYNRYKANLRDEARVEQFKANLTETISKMEPLTFGRFEYYTLTNRKAEGILLLSDLHMGVNCSNFYNTFNYEVAKARIHKLAEDTIKYCAMAGVKTLNVINLGDMIHGNIHLNARLTAEFDLINQITKASELVSWLLGTLGESGLNINYRSCTDNHSRAMANKTENIEAENFNKIIDWYLEARLSNTGVNFLHDNIDDSIGAFTLENGKKVMFAHGHLENINKVIDAFSGATKGFVDYVLLSHFHAGREKTYNGSKLIINGSIVGTEDYALSKRLFSPAEQKLLVIDKDNFIDISINLQ